MTENLMLVAHKVHGEASLDIVECCEQMGTPSDPGPWYIMPSTGHRVYPFWTRSIFDVAERGFILSDTILIPEADLRDFHFSESRRILKPAKRSAKRIATLEELA